MCPYKICSKYTTLQFMFLYENFNILYTFIYILLPNDGTFSEFHDIVGENSFIIDKDQIVGIEKKKITLFL